MKTVFSNCADVFHVFAQQQQTNAKSSNVYMEKSYKWTHDYADKIYSYGRHYLLGQFFEHDGKVYLFINDSGYSATTSKHISRIFGATRQHEQIAKSRYDLMNLVETIEQGFESLKTARKKELYTKGILQAGELLTNPNLIPCGDYVFQQRKCDEVVIGKKNIFAQYPEMKARVKKAIATFEKIAAGEIDFAAIAKAEREQKAKEKAKAEKHLASMISKWEKGEIQSFINRTDEDYLRLTGDNVETTQGVKIPVSEAAKLYSAITKGQDVQGYQIDRYRVTSLNGVLTVGCHRVNIQSMHKIGKLITA